MDDFLFKFDQTYKTLNEHDRKKFINHFVKNSCESRDLAYLTQEVDKHKSDLIKLLPVEIIEKIFFYIDPASLLRCCQVSAAWDRVISSNAKIWLEACKKLTDLDNDAADFQLTSYKAKCTQLLKCINELKSGRAVSIASLNVEINSISFYKDVFATASNLVRFYKFNKTEWICFKEFHVETRVSAFRFDEEIVLTVTYFNTVHLYSLLTHQLVRKYEAHVAAITALCYKTPLKLVVTGSVDSTIRFWAMNTSTCLHIIENMVWPLEIRIESYAENHYLLVSLNSDHCICMTHFEWNAENEVFTSNASFKIDLNEHLNETIDIDFMFDKKTRLLHLFKVIKSKASNENSNYYYLNSNSHYYNVWLVDIANGKLEAVKRNTFNVKFLFYVELKDHCVEKDDLRILAFGKRYSLLYDELNHFYVCDFTQETVNNSYKLHKLFTISSNLNLNQRTQFYFGDRQWLNGLKSSQSSAFMMAFYPMNKNSCFIINWK